MRKLDWVERKVGNSTIFIDAATVKKWLRAERARAVRVCRKQKNDNVFYNCTSVSKIHNQACDDCAAAIGKP